MTFWQSYRRAVFWHWDARLAYGATVIASALLTASPAARSTLSSLVGPAVTVSALGLTLVLGSFSLLSAMLTPDLARTLDRMEERLGRASGLDGLITSFRATAAVAALGLASWFVVGVVTAPRLTGNGWQTAEVITGGLGTGLTAWLTAGILNLMGIVATLIRGRAALLADEARGPS